MTAIDVRKISKSYGDVRALQGVSFSVEKGEVIGLLGPNGAGKTTLMKVLTGYIEADSGEATIADIDVSENPLEVQTRIGYLPENAPLYHDMTVAEYLTMMAQLRNVPAAKQRGMLADAVEATAIGDYVTRPIGHLSKGYRQRVGIAQAILHRPELLILDEPTSGLDPTQIVEIRQLIEKLSRDTTVLLSTHILPEVEMTCQRVLIIISGELKIDAKLDELQSDSAALVSVDSSAAESEVREVLSSVSGVDGVETLGDSDGFATWRVTAASGVELCPALFDALRPKDWRIGELRSDSKTLESVFRELAGGGRQEVSP